MEYISTAQAAKKWGISANRVFKLIAAGAIPRAKKLGNSWMIPENTQKPADGRTKAVKNRRAEEFFRYPGFEHRDPDSFNPPLSEEELKLKSVSEAFFACRFEEAAALLGKLPETAKNRYMRIWALSMGCLTDIYLCNAERFSARYSRLSTELAEDFPHRRELAEYLHQIDATLGSGAYYTDEFKIEPDYSYHESFLPHLAALSTVSLFYAKENVTPAVLSACELSCIMLDRTDFYIDRQSVHVYLGCACGLAGMTEKMNLHLKKAFELAEKYELYYIPAMQLFYMKKLMQPVLNELSEEFRAKLLSIGDGMHRRYVGFMSKMSVSSIFGQLRYNDYLYVYYAAVGYTNREVAERLNLSVGTVGKHYGELYSSLGISSKKELVELYRTTVGG